MVVPCENTSRDAELVVSRGKGVVVLNSFEYSQSAKEVLSKIYTEKDAG
jgi:hypothetical protein